MEDFANVFAKSSNCSTAITHNPMNPPISYALCLQHDCPVADKCLRHEAYVKMAGPVRPQITIINPAATRPGLECEGFQDAAPVRIAYGMKSALAALPHGNVAAARSELIALFGERTFYKKRNGERALSPAEQEAVTEILVRYGAEAPLHFDRCTEDYLW